MSHSSDDPGDLLLHSVSEFNAWRRDNLAVPIDLAGRDLSGADLRRAFLAGATMDGCRLDDVDLRGALLSGASLAGASLQRADLRGACFGPAELIEATLASSPVGSALVRGATLRGAALVAARAQKAVLNECDLEGADLTDCDLTGAELERANLDGATRTDPPPTLDETEALWKRLRDEPQEVREGLFRALFVMFLAGERGPQAHSFLSAVVHELGLTQADVDRLGPHGRLVLEEIEVAAPTSQWARRIALVLLFGMTQTGSAVSGTQLHALVHFGGQLGFGDRAMMRLLREELGVELSPPDDDEHE